MQWLPFFTILLLGYALGTPIDLAENAQQQPKAGDMDWWKNAVFYQIYPRSFKDSDGDGTGDLQGIISKLEYIKSLGVTAVWLSPIYPSPGKDFGYDISDFEDVDPMFGTMADFDKLVTQAHALGLRVVLDYVPNHSSDEHAWFQAALQGDEEKQNYYIWKNGKSPNEPPNNWISFFHGSAWTKRDEVGGKYYLHQFHVGQPDLDFRNPKVQQEMKDVLTFWMDRGVDGFRVDTIPNLVEDVNFPDETPTGNCPPNDRCSLTADHQTDQPETFEEVYEWRKLLEQYNKDHPDRDAIVMMTESYSSLENIRKLYHSDDNTKKGAHFSFNFRFITDVNRDKKAGDIVNVINDWVRVMSGETHNWVLGNHDQHRLISRYGLERAEGMIMLQMFLPGVAVTYMGEEIAMENGEVSWEEGKDPQGCDGTPDQWDYSSRDFERTPFQWDDSINAGFSTAPKTWLPVGSKYHLHNVAIEEGNPKSMLALYKTLIKLRKFSDVLLNGHLAVRALNRDNVVGGIRRIGTDVKIYMVLLMNVADTQQIVDLKDLQIEVIPSLLKVKAASTRSSRYSGSTISSSDIVLEPFETLIVSF